MFDRFTVLPIQIFNWMSRPQEEFQYVAAGDDCFVRFVAIYQYICFMVTKSKINWKWMKGNSNGSNSSKCTGEKRRENRDCAKEGSI